MYLDYLKNKKTEIIKEIDVRNSRISDLSFKIREKTRFIEYLEKESTTPFTEFTPQVITAGDKKKKEIMGDELQILLETRETIQDEITLLENELSEINSSISDIKKTISNQKKQIKEEKNLVITGLSNISEIVIQDPMRASIEIKNLIKQLSENS